MQGLHRNFFYLNLNTRQSVLFFSDVYCDYQLVAKHLYDILKQNYSASFHLAVSSRFEGHEALPEIMSQLEPVSYTHLNPRNGRQSIVPSSRLSIQGEKRTFGIRALRC